MHVKCDWIVQKLSEITYLCHSIIVLTELQDGSYQEYNYTTKISSKTNYMLTYSKNNDTSSRGSPDIIIV